jgi:hypothetical protein
MARVIADLARGVKWSTGDLWGTHPPPVSLLLHANAANAAPLSKFS